MFYTLHVLYLYISTQKSNGLILCFSKIDYDTDASCIRRSINYFKPT